MPQLYYAEYFIFATYCEIRKWIPPAVFFLKILLNVHELLRFHINFKILFYIALENVTGILAGVKLEL